jgi:hypothetical protein
MDIFKKNPLLLAAITAVMIGSFAAKPAFAEDTAAADAVQALTDALTEAAAGTDAEEATDASAGLPKFGSRQERREYFEKLREEDPDKFKEIMEKRKERWVRNHPGQEGPRGPRKDFRENRFDRREDRWDARHDGGKRDRREDRYDRREDRWDANHGSDRGRHPGRPAAHRS